MYLYKSGFLNIFKVKMNCRSQKLTILPSSKINSTNEINSLLNHPNMRKSILFLKFNG